MLMKSGILYKMKPLDDEAILFCAALLAEMTARGRGIQKKLARQTGISSGLICDLRAGRTGGSPEKRQALAEALGYRYEDFLAKGRELEEEKQRAQMKANSSSEEERENQFRTTIRNLSRRLENFRHRASVLAQKLITLQEKHIAAQEEITRLQRENDNLRRPAHLS